jgi:dTDP-4-amino-4,6-dideoxygalactose transaminase
MMKNPLLQFEYVLSKFTGAPYVVVTDGCTHALELCLRYDQVKKCEFTAFTYLSVVMTMHHLGIDYTLTDEQWSGEYQLHGTRIWDSARRLQRNMYRPGQIQCLSFGPTKPLQLGRCGAILLDDEIAYRELSMMRVDGRDLNIDPWIEQKTFKVGYHYQPSFESCREGMTKLLHVDQEIKQVTYNDLRTITIVG